jgi:threonine/homoserine/homoserine lactone efflux protein
MRYLQYLPAVAIISYSLQSGYYNEISFTVGIILGGITLMGLAMVFTLCMSMLSFMQLDTESDDLTP